MKSLSWYGILILAVIVFSAGPKHSSALAQIFRPRVNAIPARQLGPGFSYRPQTEPVDASQLRLTPTKEYYLDSDDVLGIFIDGVLGEFDQAPPVHYPPSRCRWSIR